MRLSPQAAQASPGAVRDLQVPERAQVPSPRRREDPLPQPSYVALRRAPVNGVPTPRQSFVGPFTMRCPTCPPIPTELTSIRFTTHLPTSAPLSGPGHRGSVSGQLSSNGRLGGAATIVVGFLSAFAHRHSLLGHPVPARGFRHPLRLAYRTATAARTLSGFPRSARVRHDRGGCLLYSGAAVSSRPPRPR